VADGAGVGDVLIERGVDYGLGKLADTYLPTRDGPAPLALLWHGIGVDERDVLEPPATEVAALGVAVMVPDWESEVPDGGRAHLLASLDFARGLARDRPAELMTGRDGEFVLVGWSRGGRMAASLALNPETAGGWRPSAVVCLAGGFHRETVNIQQSRDFAAAAAGCGWPIRLTEPDTDHAGVVMIEYDPARRRCLPTIEPHAVAAGRLSARTIAQAARTIPRPMSDR
jgi:hypothetical protein